jgi:hypothetical protein
VPNIVTMLSLLLLAVASSSAGRICHGGCIWTRRVAGALRWNQYSFQKWTGATLT